MSLQDRSLVDMNAKLLAIVVSEYSCFLLRCVACRPRELPAKENS